MVEYVELPLSEREYDALKMLFLQLNAQLLYPDGQVFVHVTML